MESLTIVLAFITILLQLIKELLDLSKKEEKNRKERRGENNPSFILLTFHKIAGFHSLLETLQIYHVLINYEC